MKKIVLLIRTWYFPDLFWTAEGAKYLPPASASSFICRKIFVMRAASRLLSFTIKIWDSELFLVGRMSLLFVEEYTKPVSVIRKFRIKNSTALLSPYEFSHTIISGYVREDKNAKTRISRLSSLDPFHYRRNSERTIT